MPSRTVIAILLGIASLTGCGAASEDAQGPSQSGASPVQPADPGGSLELPLAVPRRATGAAVGDQARVIRAWTAALRAGDIDKASALWAVPSKVQNGTPVVGLTTSRAVRAFNASLPCGSVVTSIGRAGRDFTIAKVRLTARRGASCDAPEGATARTAIRVRAGRIVEWYRLPDDPDAPGLLPTPADDIDSTTV